MIPPKHLATLSCLLYILCTFQFEAKENVDDSKVPSPLILVPGDGGARAYAHIKYFNWFTIKALVWVNFQYMAFPTLLRNVFELTYDPKTRKTRDFAHSHVLFPGWGSTETIEELDDRQHSQTIYFAPLVTSLIKDSFYVRNKTIRGAPYDFRKAPNENENFVADMKKLVEDTYNISDNRRVVILGHSLGSLYSLYFLKKMTIPWKQKYVRSFIAVSGPLGGAVKAVALQTTGDSLGSPRSPLYFRVMQRSFPSSTFLLPRHEFYGPEAIVITPKRNYSAYDFKELFEDMNLKYGLMMYDDTKDLVKAEETPEGIDELYCIHSHGLQTPKQLVFKSFPDEQPDIIYGDGDHTVNINSLEVCKNWTNVNYYTINGADHMKIVGTPEFLNKLKQILYRQPNLQFIIEPLDNFGVAMF